MIRLHTEHAFGAGIIVGKEIILAEQKEREAMQAGIPFGMMANLDDIDEHNKITPAHQDRCLEKLEGKDQ